MNTINIKLDEKDAPVWNQLPPVCQDLPAHKTIYCLLNGYLYPTTEQIELAIELAENNVSPALIAKLTRLEKEVFEGFLPK